MIPSIEDLTKFLQQHQPANYSKIARAFGIKVVTVSEIVKPLAESKFLEVQKVGSDNFVKLANEN